MGNNTVRVRIRHYLQYKDTTICLDKNMYLGKADYELELEYLTELDDSLLEKIKEVGLDFKQKVVGKSGQFYKEYMENWISA